MPLLVQFELARKSKFSKELELSETVDEISSIDWKKQVDDWEGWLPPSLEIINPPDQRKLIITVLQSKAKGFEFTVECHHLSKAKKNDVGILINEQSLSDVIDITSLFYEHDYSAIEAMENVGWFSKLLRKITYKFA